VDPGSTGTLGNYQVCHRADEGQVSRERVTHRNHQPNLVLIGEALNKELERKDRRHIADDIGERRRQPAGYLI
jgi:hypothetical protein